MTLVMALSQLWKARQFVSDGEECMVRQREIIDWLEGGGYDSLDAVLFLEYLEDMQEQYVAHRDRLEQQVLRLVRPSED